MSKTGSKRMGLILMAGLLLFMTAAEGHAAGQSSANYQVPTDVVSGGGGGGSSTNYSAGHTTGQATAIGESNSANYKNHAGFWYTFLGMPVDADGDGIVDGDGANPCTGGNTADCDDNCVNTANEDQLDTDADGVGDLCDNCRLTKNSGQQDTNSDGYGNACDCDLDNSNFVGAPDYNIFKKAWLTDPSKANWNPDANFDADNFIGPKDYNIFKTRWLKSGPWM